MEGWHLASEDAREHDGDASVALSGAVGTLQDVLLRTLATKYPELSQRERAVLLTAARGAEDKEIAAMLGCSVSTIRTLWQRAYSKTRLVSRRKLIASVWEAALISERRRHAVDVDPNVIAPY